MRACIRLRFACQIGCIALQQWLVAKDSSLTLCEPIHDSHGEDAGGAV